MKRFVGWRSCLVVRRQSAVHCCLFSGSSNSRNDRKKILELPLDFLRASCPAHWDSNGQRTDVPFDPVTGKIIIRKEVNHRMSTELNHCKFSNGHYQLSWKDGHTSRFSSEWVDAMIMATRKQQHPTHGYGSERVLWSGLNGDDIRNAKKDSGHQHPLCLQFDNVIETDAGRQAAVRALYTHGLCLVQDTPLCGSSSIDAAASIAALGAAVSGGSVKNSSASLIDHYRNGGRSTMLMDGTDGPYRTLYGSVWSTTTQDQAEGLSTADSAYGTGSLPLHTDMTYYKEPPGVQIFGMVQNAAGGESIFADGFFAAQQLRQEFPQAFETLSSVPRRYRSVDPVNGWHLEASGPVIQVVRGHDRVNSDHDYNVEVAVTQIRHNDLDRLPNLPPPQLGTAAETKDFYEQLHWAHNRWDEILSHDATRLVMDLQPGETILVANQRILHGRTQFHGHRSVTGCYVSQEDLNSRFRIEGLKVL